jgi:hypothetical protein
MGPAARRRVCVGRNGVQDSVPRQESPRQQTLFRDNREPKTTDSVPRQQKAQDNRLCPKTTESKTTESKTTESPRQQRVPGRVLVERYGDQDALRIAASQGAFLTCLQPTLVASGGGQRWRPAFVSISTRRAMSPLPAAVRGAAALCGLAPALPMIRSSEEMLAACKHFFRIIGSAVPGPRRCAG